MASLATCRAGWELRCPQFPLHSILLPSLYIISSNKKSPSRLPLTMKKTPFSRMKLHGSPKCCPAPLAGQGCVQPYLHPTTAREGNGVFFSPLGNSWGGSLLCSGSPRSLRLLWKLVVNRTFSPRMRGGTGSKVEAPAKSGCDRCPIPWGWCSTSSQLCL